VEAVAGMGSRGGLSNSAQNLKRHGIAGCQDEL